MSTSHSSSDAPVFLIGYMASGKTTLGRALAAATGRRFIDLDEYIEASTGKTISRIFAEDGEDHFRRTESRLLSEIIDNPGNDGGVVVACGGGTPCFGDNMSVMNDAGLTVWLTAPHEVIIRRLIAERSARPLVAQLSDGGELENYVIDNLRCRAPHYGRAATRFDSSRLETESEIADSVRLFIEKYLP